MQPVPSPRGENPQLARHDGNEYACILEMPLPPPPPGATVDRDATDASGVYETNQRAPPTLQRIHKYPVNHQMAPQYHQGNQDGGYHYPVGGEGGMRELMPYEEDPRYFELDPENLSDNNCNAAPGMADVMNHRIMEEREKYPSKFSK